LRGFVLSFIVSRRLSYFLVFSISLVLRALPEFLSGVYPVGFDALAGYVPAVVALPDHAPMILFGWDWSPLAVYLLWFVRWITGVEPFLLLKVAGPVFYAFFTVSFYYMLLHGLEWDEKKSFMVALLFLFQPAVLRMGWDQLREELGLVFFFLLLAKTKCDIVSGARHKGLTVLVLSLLIVFSHQLAAFLFFAVVLWQLFDTMMKRDRAFFRGFVVVLPSAVFFVWQLYKQFINPGYSLHFVPIRLPTGTDIFVFTNYFLSDPRFLDGNYLKVLSYVGSLSLYCVVPLVPFALKGFFRDRVFTPILVWLSLASYSIVFSPTYAFSMYWWWILLLPIPLTVYAGQGLEKLGVFRSPKRLKAGVFGLILLGGVALGYATSVVPIGYPHAYSYIPSGLAESCVGFGDVPDVETALHWVNENMPISAIVIVPENFQGFAFMKLRADLQIRVAPSVLNLSGVINRININDGDLYAVYYSKDVGNCADIETILKIGIIGVYRISNCP